MNNKELTLESILSEGMGMVYDKQDKPKQSYESFNDASIIDNTYINNDLSYIKTLESLYINHSKNTINLYKRLNNIYGKGKSKSLESYLYNKSLDINNKCKSYIENSNESYNRLLEMSREDTDVSNAQKGRMIGAILGSFLIPGYMSLVAGEIGEKMGEKKDIENFKKEKSELSGPIKEFNKNVIVGLYKSFSKLREGFKNVSKVVNSEDVVNLKLSSSLFDFKKESKNEEFYFIGNLLSGIGTKFEIRSSEFKNAKFKNAMKIKLEMNKGIKRENVKYTESILKYFNNVLSTNGVSNCKFYIEKEKTLFNNIILGLEIDFKKDYYDLFDKIRKYLNSTMNVGSSVVRLTK